MFADHSGAEFAVWQSGKFVGAAAQKEPRAFVWSELITDDMLGIGVLDKLR